MARAMDAATADRLASAVGVVADKTLCRGEMLRHTAAMRLVAFHDFEKVCESSAHCMHRPRGSAPRLVCMRGLVCMHVPRVLCGALVCMQGLVCMRGGRVSSVVRSRAP